MHVARRGDQRHVAVSGPLVLRRAPAVRVGRFGRIREAAVATAATALDVEDRIGTALLHVHPDRPDRLHRAPEPRVLRNEVDVVGDPDVLGNRRLVMEHVVEGPNVAALHRVAVAGGQLEDRLLLARGDEVRIAAVRVVAGCRKVDPDSVVEVDHVDRGHGPVRTHEVGLEPDHVPVVGRLLDRDGPDQDEVLARRDVKRPVLEVQAQDVGAERGHAAELRHRRPGGGCARRAGQDCRQRRGESPSPHEAPPAQVADPTRR